MQPTTEQLKLAISSCLLGSRVRYDGGHKKDDHVLDLLSPHVEWMSICPEVEAGMGTPREPVKLVRSASGISMLGTSSGIDHTASMKRLAGERVTHLRSTRVSGYVFKSGSPSCGIWDTPIEGDASLGRGLFAAEVTEQMPELPVEDESRLKDRVVRDNFIERAFAYRRLDAFFSGGRTRGQLVMFHSQSTLQLMSHSPSGLEQLSALITASVDGPSDIATQYRRAFMDVLSSPSTRDRHVGALTAAVGRLKSLHREQRIEMAEAIDRFADGQTPLLVPLTLIAHHVRETKDAYLHGQTYLDPDPRETALRYHA